MVVLLGFVHLYTDAANCAVVGAATTTVNVIGVPIQALYKPVLEVMPVGVGGKYIKLTDFAVPAIPHALWPFAVIAPPVNPVLYDNVIDELSTAALVIVVFAGFVHLYILIADCDVVGAGAVAV